LTNRSNIELIDFIINLLISNNRLIIVAGYAKIHLQEISQAVTSNALHACCWTKQYAIKSYTGTINCDCVT